MAAVMIPGQRECVWARGEQGQGLRLWEIVHRLKAYLESCCWIWASGCGGGECYPWSRITVFLPFVAVCLGMVFLMHALHQKSLAPDLCSCSTHDIWQDNRITRPLNLNVNRLKCFAIGLFILVVRRALLNHSIPVAGVTPEQFQSHLLQNHDCTDVTDDKTMQQKVWTHSEKRHLWNHCLQLR